MKKEDAVIMENFKHSSGWALIAKRIEKLISDYENALMEIDPEANEKLYTRHDLYRMLRKCLIAIKTEPERIISLFEKSEKSTDYTNLF